MKLIYCDGPYKDTTGYKNASKKTDFDFEEYYEWLRSKVSEGHIVLVSEYQMPEDFVCVWSKEIRNQLVKTEHSRNTEKLFVHESQLELYRRSFPDEA